MSKAVYVYRLAAAMPPGSDAPGWEPDNWPEWCEEHGWTKFDSETGATELAVFSWTNLMRRKHFLSAGAAERRAKMLRVFGAEVTVEKSAPVGWSA